MKEVITDTWGALARPKRFFKEVAKKPKLSDAFRTSAVLIAFFLAMGFITLHFFGPAAPPLPETVEGNTILEFTFVGIPHLPLTVPIPLLALMLAFSYAGWLVYGFMAALVTALYMRFLGAKLDYERGFALWAYSSLPWFLLGWTIALPLSLMRTSAVGSPVALLMQPAAIMHSPLGSIGWIIALCAWTISFFATVFGTQMLYKWSFRKSLLAWVSLKLVGLLVVIFAQDIMDFASLFTFVFR